MTYLSAVQPYGASGEVFRTEIVGSCTSRMRPAGSRIKSASARRRPFDILANRSIEACACRLETDPSFDFEREGGFFFVENAA